MASVVALLYAPQGDIAYVPKGTTVVNPDTGEATYSDGVMSGRFTGFRVVEVDFELTNKQKKELIVKTNSGDPATGYAYIVSPTEAGIVSLSTPAGGHDPKLYFVPNDGWVGEVDIDVTATNEDGEPIMGGVVLIVQKSVATSLIVIPGETVDK